MTGAPPLRLTILLIEDEDSQADAIEGFLRQRWRDVDVDLGIERAHTLAAGMEGLAGQPDVLVLDLVLPDSRGLATYETVRAAHPDLPIVVLSARIGGTEAIHLLREGVLTEALDKRELGTVALPRAIVGVLARSRRDLDLARLLNLN